MSQKINPLLYITDWESLIIFQLQFRTSFDIENSPNHSSYLQRKKELALELKSIKQEMKANLSSKAERKLKIKQQQYAEKKKLAYAERDKLRKQVTLSKYKVHLDYSRYPECYAGYKKLQQIKNQAIYQHRLTGTTPPHLYLINSRLEEIKDTAKDIQIINNKVYHINYKLRIAHGASRRK